MITQIKSHFKAILIPEGYPDLYLLQKILLRKDIIVEHLTSWRNKFYDRDDREPVIENIHHTTTSYEGPLKMVVRGRTPHGQKRVVHVVPGRGITILGPKRWYEQYEFMETDKFYYIGLDENTLVYGDVLNGSFHQHGAKYFSLKQTHTTVIDGWIRSLVYSHYVKYNRLEVKMMLPSYYTWRQRSGVVSVHDGYASTAWKTLSPSWGRYDRLLHNLLRARSRDRVIDMAEAKDTPLPLIKEAYIKEDISPDLFEEVRSICKDHITALPKNIKMETLLPSGVGFIKYFQ